MSTLISAGMITIFNTLNHLVLLIILFPEQVPNSPNTVVHPEGGVYARAKNGFMNFSVYGEELHVNMISLTGEKLFSVKIPRH